MPTDPSSDKSDPVNIRDSLESSNSGLFNLNNDNDPPPPIPLILYSSYTNNSITIPIPDLNQQANSQNFEVPIPTLSKNETNFLPTLPYTLPSPFLFIDTALVQQLVLAAQATKPIGNLVNDSRSHQETPSSASTPDEYEKIMNTIQNIQKERINGTHGSKTTYFYDPQQIKPLNRPDNTPPSKKPRKNNTSSKKTQNQINSP